MQNLECSGGPLDRSKIDAFLDEVRAVCRKHGVFLRGTCASEGIYGEILIGDASNPESSGWKSALPVNDIDYENTTIDGIA